MSVTGPTYYKSFRCLADKCPHSCCVGWRIALDEGTVEKYRRASGDYAECLRKSVTVDEDGAYIPLSHGRCPHLDDGGLCRVIREFGEGYLSDICREHPRFYNLVGGQIEVGLGASCPEAARLILGEEGSLELEDIPEHTRYTAQEKSCSYSPISARNRVSKIISKFDEYAKLEQHLIEDLSLPKIILSPKYRLEILKELEFLGHKGRALVLDCAEGGGCEDIKLKRLLEYFIYRHLSRAENEMEMRGAAGFALFSVRVVEAMAKTTADLANSLMIYSEQIEYCEENTEAIIFEIESELI